MNFIGKTFVILYTVMALACLMWATVIFTNRVDWAPPKDAPEAAKGGPVGKDGAKEPPPSLLGKVNQSNAEIVKLDAANERANKRYISNYVTANAAENDRLFRRYFYRARLEIAVTGKLNGMPVEGGAYRELKFAESGLIEPDLEVDDQGKMVAGAAFKSAPVINVRPNKALESADIYQKQIDGTNKTILETQDKILALIEEHKRLTTIINSEQLDGPFKGIKKGLRLLIKDQIAIEKIAVDERESLSDYITNRRAEGQLFVKRRDLLQARVEELMRLRPSKDGKLE
jgi:hypothetical protein